MRSLRVIRLMVVCVAVWVTAVSVGAPPSAAAEPEPPSRPLVVLWAIDGLEPTVVSESSMPYLSEIAGGGVDDVSMYRWRDARAIMVSETYPNHTAMITGARGAVSGVPANTIWTGASFKPVDARHLRVDTVFDVLAAEKPELSAALVMGDPGLYKLFADEPAVSNWNPKSARIRVPLLDYAIDSIVVDQAIRRVDEGVDFLFVNTQLVDTMGHFTGVQSRQTRMAMRDVDQELRRFIDELGTRGRWADTTLLIASDHGMDRTPRKLWLWPKLLVRGYGNWHVSGHGGFASVAKPGGATEAEAAAVRDVISAVSGVTEAHVVGAELDAAHPDWGLSDERTGDVVALARAGTSFFDPIDPVLNTHGAPTARDNWISILGPPSRVQAGDDGVNTAENIDLAPTLAELLDVSAPGASSGRVLDEALVPG